MGQIMYKPIVNWHVDDLALIRIRFEAALSRSKSNQQILGTYLSTYLIIYLLQ